VIPLLLLLSSAAPEGTTPTLAAAIERVVSAPPLAAASWGIEVRDLGTGAVVYQKNGRKSFRPASTLKLVTTAAALDALGGKDEPQTTLETAAPLAAGGVLDGDLFLVGGGDPDLSEVPLEGREKPPLDTLADAVVAAGIREVRGRLVGHEGLFAGPRRGAGWGWEDLVWWYGAEVSALSFNDNCAHLTVSPGERAGDPLRVEARPKTAYYKVDAQGTTSPAGTKSDLRILRELGETTIHLSGTHPQGEAPADLNVAVENPALFAATLFREALEARGVRVSRVATSSDPLPSPRRVLATLPGMPLADGLRTINKRSQNLHAEILLRLLGARTKGEGSVEAGLVAVSTFLAKAGVSAADWDLEDGSGLSDQDLVTPHGIVDLLAAMDRHKEARAFKESLPIAGRDGSLRGRMKGTRAEGRVVAKTGSVSHVAALAGYVQGSRPLAVAIFVNAAAAPAREASAAIDAICVLLAR
jgi:D-alanyl-D-alanine carboxypeptidase/D-alanyl-D-alanine-endopeptidase (penicillin-binding protein 4)